MCRSFEIALSSTVPPHAEQTIEHCMRGQRHYKARTSCSVYTIEIICT